VQLNVQYQTHISNTETSPKCDGKDLTDFMEYTENARNVNFNITDELQGKMNNKFKNDMR